MTYRILSIAAKDLAVAVGYYEAQYAGLGFDFLDEFESTISRICQCPAAWKRVGKNHRRTRLRRFPYGVLYCHDTTGIVVSGIMHLRMNPEEQRSRISKTEGLFENDPLSI